jgi:hypothetical protein
MNKKTAEEGKTAKQPERWIHAIPFAKNRETSYAVHEKKSGKLFSQESPCRSVLNFPLGRMACSTFMGSGK